MQRRFATLDGVRGVAAIGVASSHAGFYPQISSTVDFLPNYGLAVDVFFMLSGFVLAYAYEERFQAGMKTREFMLLRIIRLYPLYLAGLALAMATAVAAIAVGHPQMIAPATLTLMLAAALLFLPSPTRFESDAIAPLNPPSWSLMFELLANLAYVALYRRLTNAVLAAIVLASVLAMVAAEWRFGHLHGGAYWTDVSLGFVRVGFSFPLGILLFRTVPHRCVTTRWAYAVPFLVVPILAIPVSAPVIIELPALLFLFPLIVTVGALIEPPDQRLFLFLGATSYALYILHLPVVRIAARLAEMKVLSFGDPGPVPLIAVISGLLALCALLDRRYDAPVRRMLLRRFARRRPQASLDAPATASTEDLATTTSKSRLRAQNEGRHATKIRHTRRHKGHRRDRCRQRARLRLSAARLGHEPVPQLHAGRGPVLHSQRLRHRIRL